MVLVIDAVAVMELCSGGEMQTALQAARDSGNRDTDLCTTDVRAWLAEACDCVASRDALQTGAPQFWQTPVSGSMLADRSKHIYVDFRASEPKRRHYL